MSILGAKVQTCKKLAIQIEWYTYSYYSIETFLVIFKHSVTEFIIQECIFEIAVAVVSNVRSEGNMKNTFDKIH